VVLTALGALAQEEGAGRGHLSVLPLTTPFVDPTGDARSGGMDITSVVVSTDSGKLSFAIDIPSHPTLPAPKYVGVGFDSDLNARTGNSFGLEYRIWLDGSKATIQLDRWQNGTWVSVATSSLAATYQGGLRFAVDAAAIASSFDFVVETYAQDGSTLEDVAPDRGRWRFGASQTCFGSTATGGPTEGPDVLIGTPGDDVIDGLGGDDRICGGGGTDILLGGLGNDQIDGGSELDGIEGGEGDDRLFGGLGIDLVTYTGSPRPVAVNLSTGVATGQGTDALAEFEGASGSSFDDALDGDAAGNFLFPLRGNDTVRGGAGIDFVLFNVSAVTAIQANLGTGTVTGEGTDRLAAIEGLNGPGTLVGDSGPNYLVGTDGRDVLSGMGGDDVLLGSGGADTVRGGAGADLISGGLGDDTLLDGGPGAGDVLNFLDASNGVRVDLGARRATGMGSDRVVAFEVVAGSQFADRLRGGPGADTLEGKGGDDVIEGLAGNDVLDGGSGRDRLAGGPGTDYCLEGEALASCETRRSSRLAAAAAPAVARSAGRPSVRAGTGAPAAAATIASILRAVRSTELVQAKTSSRDTVQYVPSPECRQRPGGGSLTWITPPKIVQPVAGLAGTQTARWQGILLVGRREVFRTPPLEAVVVDDLHPLGPGYAVDWHPRGTRSPYQPEKRRVDKSPPARWEAEVSIVEQQRPASRHEVVPPVSCPKR
jgi:Ca2+-binding RTX toxin-like protein